MAKDVNWYAEDVKLAVQGVAMESLLAIAHQLIAEAKVDAPVETGFMRNSGYVVGAGDNTFIAQRDTANGRDYATVDNPPPVADNEVVAGFAADYTIHVEERHPFIYPALVRVAQQVAGIVQKVDKL
jgi:hypothetical protein